MSSQARKNCSALQGRTKMVIKESCYLPSFDGIMGVGWFPPGEYRLEVVDDWDSFLYDDKGNKKHIVTKELDLSMVPVEVM